MYPEVPVNWFMLALEATEAIRALMAKACVTKLVNMDEMFLNFYPKKTHWIVLTGTKRVGANRKEDEKTPCTLYHHGWEAPRYLAKRYLNWDGYASYLEWLSECYPDECVGLIWGHAAAHITDDVLVYAAELGIIVGFIPAGITSILQVCDLFLNKPLKAAFKRSCCAYKMRCDLGPGGKYKGDRDDIVIWIEEATKEAHKKQLPTRGITEAFRRYGQDPREESNYELVDHLKGLEESRVYASLLEKQCAADLD
ncbi:hypothetical protein ACHHYP_06125 [Achlya hypogyna]|uniref:DDE-1 domain-containing protein n=1 Tax=Achlya hypogyna TaxID=1202772 RepID=A0A1V9YV51_ACHHY|nr:hypothetical protein ACHHYP_06125 [Achlya hypogyna]